MNRTSIQTLWNDLHTQNTWVPATSRALAGLNPEQASWTPAPDRHSIWQLTNHLIFWHRFHLEHITQGTKLTKELLEQHNWEAPTEITQAAWDTTTSAYHTMHQQIAQALTDPAFPLDDMPNMIMHTCYHLGQILHLRAMQGLPPIE